jgi:L-alanine-DL-glutamate epimerase-like enolase superfamily enzyme
MADDPRGMVDECQRAIQEFGIKVLCLKAGHRWGWRQDVKNFLAVREALGEVVVLGVDPNTGWHLEGALRAVEAMLPHRLDYLEQPIERRDYAGLAAIRHALKGVPLMADESVVTVQDAYALARAGACDVLCIKLYKMGGLRAAKKIAAVAEAANLRVNIGGLATLSQLDAAAGAHLYASTPAELVMPAAEFVFGLGALGNDPLVPSSELVVRDGCVEPPSRPGLGVSIDETALASITLRKEIVVR